MNILINTPLLNSPGLRESFDNKVLVIFIGIIFVLLAAGILFLDLTKYYQSSQINEEKSSPAMNPSPLQAAGLLFRA